MSENTPGYMIRYPDGSGLTPEDFTAKIAKPVADSMRFITDELREADNKNRLLRKQRAILVTSLLIMGFREAWRIWQEDL